MIPPMDHDPRPAPPYPNPPIGPGAPPLVASMVTLGPPPVTPRGNPVVPPDPGTPRSRNLAFIAAVLIAGLTILWQNIGHDRQQDLIGAPPAPPPPAQAADKPAPAGMAEPMARIFLRLAPILRNQPGPSKRDFIEQVAAMATEPADRVRVAILAGEYLGPEAALERTAAVRNDRAAQSDDPEAPDPIAAELDAVDIIYTDGPHALDPAVRDQFAVRYGKIGAYALSRGEPEAEREAIIGGPWPVIMLALGFLALAGGTGLIGTCVLVWGIVWYANPRTRMRCPRPLPGGSVMLETYALFVGCFAALVIGSSLVQAHAPSAVAEAAGALQLPLQWFLMLTVLWPLVRGMDPRRWRHAVGLTRGDGVAREIGCGVLAYLACVPLYFLGVVITLVLVALWEMINPGPTDAPVPNKPIVELVGTGNLWIIVLVFALATVWAPITEELIFRGALFRHFRARTHWAPAALLSACLFAYMHSYGPLMVAPLILLGFMFAFMREWRGSIIAPMTAHFLHNFTLITLMIIAFQIIG